ncbi:MAG: amino acid racemase [Candidatus Paceibacterota bacterium]|jgi:aspartate racemase
MIKNTIKTIGIIGGVGPETTSKIYHSIIDTYKRQSDRYPSIVIYNLPFPFIIENEAIAKGINVHKMLPFLIDGAKILEKSGADFGILPCNTLHKYIKEIREAVKIPFLSILDETVLELISNKVKTVGVLATETTVKDRLYDSLLGKNGINVLYPTETEQKTINQLILELINKTKGKCSEQQMEEICSSLHKKGAGAILLACTDLQLAKINSKIPIFDTTDILIAASVRELFK